MTTFTREYRCYHYITRVCTVRTHDAIFTRTNGTHPYNNLYLSPTGILSLTSNITASVAVMLM